jgi:branched-subunit amino acid ABC-type transport system permease component
MGLPPGWLFLLLPLGALSVALIGIVIEPSLLRPFYRRAEEYQLLVTFGLIQILEDSIRLIWGGTPLVSRKSERGMIRERVNAGLARAKERGIRLGRRPVKSSVEARIHELRAEGMGILKIGRTLRVGTSVVQRVLAAATS